MLISLGIYLHGLPSLPPGRPLQHEKNAPHVPLSHIERRSVPALCLIILCVRLFWAAYDQQGNTIVLWAEDYTDRVIDLGFWRGVRRLGRALMNRGSPLPPKADKPDST
jgi:POT family proton-dependent oligopeptide transporter